MRGEHFMRLSKTRWLIIACLFGAAWAGSAHAAGPVFAGSKNMNEAANSLVTPAAVVCNGWGRCWSTRRYYVYRPYYRPRITCRTGVRYTAWGLARVSRCYRY
jgi:hypothetical protein